MRTTICLLLLCVLVLCQVTLSQQVEDKATSVFSDSENTLSGKIKFKKIKKTKKTYYGDVENSQ